MTTKETMSRRIWMHEVTVAAVKGGANAEWITAHFSERLVIWFNAGETMEGAVQMLLASLEGEKKEARHSERTPAQVAKSINLNIPATAAERVARVDAKAKLVEAAPDLLASLQELLASGLHLRSDVPSDVLLRAHAAVIKAGA